MTEYLVEVYVPRAAAARTMPPLDAFSRAPAMPCDEQQAVRLQCSIFLPEDEICLYLFEGQSHDAVKAAALGFGLQVERVVEARSESARVS